MVKQLRLIKFICQVYGVWGPIFEISVTQSYDNLKIFVQYTLILRQIYDITTILRTLLTL